MLYGSDAVCRSRECEHARAAAPPFLRLFYEGDAGTFTTFRNLAQLGGTHKKFDYYGGFDAFQSDNSIKMDEFHDDTASANLGYAFSLGNPASGNRPQ